MFKVVVAVLVLSDTGSATTALHSIDMHDPVACDRLAQGMSYEAEKTALGHKFLVRSKGRCEPDAPVGDAAVVATRPRRLPLPQDPLSALIPAFPFD